MSSARQRRTRGEGDQLRAELVDAAIALLLEPQALPAPSLRAIARASAVAPSAVYLQFPSQEALMQAVAEELFSRLRQALDAADTPNAEPAARVQELAKAYLTWAQDYPGAYQLLFERPDPPTAPGTGPGLDLLDRLAALLRAQGLTPPADQARALQLWCVLHGVASLRIHKPTAPWLAAADSDTRALVEAVLSAP